MPKSRMLLSALLLGLACRRPAAGPVAVDSTTLAAAHRGVPMIDPEVRLVASITLAMRDHPQFKDSIFPAYRLTQAQFDSMKAEVLADSAKKASFDRLTGVAAATTHR